MFELARETNRLKESNPDDAVKLAALLRKLGAVIGILSSDATEFLRSGNADVEPFYIDDLLLRRNLARAEKNWLEADKIRDELKALNVVVEDRDGISSWRIDR
jgi:cysteinyl-tRNA synthetase